MHSVKMVFMQVVGLLCIITSAVHGTSLGNLVAGNVSTHHCGTNETDCPSGCCPLPNAVCCSDGIYCCPAGNICIPFVGICVGTNDNDGAVSLATKKPTQLRSSSLFWCPPGYTECPSGGCCANNGTCCPDNKSCCPNGWECDPTSTYCFKDTVTEIGSQVVHEPVTKSRRKSPYKSCPGENRVCPAYQTCCTHENGEKGCCPDPTLTNIRYDNGECCRTIFGEMCCPDDAPTCTFFGCI